MMRNRRPRDPRNYSIGIDVGTHSVGLAAVEIGEQGAPVAILSALSWIHDSGVLESKTATTRLAAAGVARRVRRLRRRRVKRLEVLDRKLSEWGWEPLAPDGDPYQPWRARCRLVMERIDDETELQSNLATALRHMARHRGWRNPYMRASSLYKQVPSSEFLAGLPASGNKAAVAGFKQRVEARVGASFHDDVTVAQLAVAAIDHNNRIPLRMGKTPQHVVREFSYLGGKLLQTDNANEIHTYATVQGISEKRVREIIDIVFAAESPRGSWVGKIGRDPFDGKLRAPKSSDAFQRFRIASTLSHVRVKDAGADRPIQQQELVKAYEYLVNLKPSESPTWGDLGEVIGKARKSLAGAASTNFEGEERLPARPPVHATDQTIRSLRKLGSLRDYWVESNGEFRDAIIALISDGLKDEGSQAGTSAWDLMNILDEDALDELDRLDLPAGRAAYSTESLRKLTQHILMTGDNLHEARKAVFGVRDDWVPPSEPIGAPVGNPAVDRVLKIIARFLLAAESEWGAPQNVTIEHVRDAFTSESTRRENDRDNQRRFKAKLEQRESIGTSVKIEGRVSSGDIRRFEAVQRQKGLCLYCGNGITFDTAELDHIVPRKGQGSTSTKNNLAAVCLNCNREKSKEPFAAWAARSNNPEISPEKAVERTRFWLKDNGVSPRAWNVFLKEVRDRLERTEADPPIDARSMESVAWMANELRDRIAAHFHSGNTNSGIRKVSVYQGSLTADARRLTGMEGMIPWIGGYGKTRLDRRHHAVDAAVLTLFNDSVARTLAERISMRVEEGLQRIKTDKWKEYGGVGAAKERFGEWESNMSCLTALLTDYFLQDRVVVAENVRLRLGNGRVHEDTIKPFVRFKVGDALPRKVIDAASTPQLWIALTRDPDFDEKSGLPENLHRRIRVRSKWLNADDEIEFFDKPRAALAIQGGWAELGKSIHHARIYRWQEKGKTRYCMLRVFAVDLVKYPERDLFNIPPEKSWVSMRCASESIQNIDLMSCEYVGWLVPGDEILVRSEVPVVEHLGPISRWKVRGFEDANRFNVEPRYISREGLTQFLERANLSDDEEKAIREMVEGKGRRPVSSFFQTANPVIIHRDALGRPRLRSAAGLPVTWTVR